MWCSYQACRVAESGGLVGRVGDAVLGGERYVGNVTEKSQKAAGVSRRPSEVSASLWRFVPKAKPPKAGGW